MQRHLTPTFYGLSTKITKVGNFFYRSSLFCFLLEKFRFERYANIILVNVTSWIVKEMDRKLVVVCDVFSVLMAFKPNCKL